MTIKPIVNIIWKDIKNYENSYQINNFGEIKSLPKNSRYNSERILLSHEERLGYLSVALYDINHNVKRIKIHRLVAEAFIPNPFNFSQVNHLNGIKSDNYVENLEWCSAKNNVAHSIKTGLRNNAGENNYCSVLTKNQVSEIRQQKNKISYRNLAKIYGVSKTTIAYAMMYKTYKNE